MNPLLFPPALIKRALDDLGAIADAARQVARIELTVVGRLDGLSAQLERIRQDAEPLGELPLVRDDLAALHGAVEPLAGKLDLLRAEMRPIQELSTVREQLEKVRAAVEPLGDKLDELRADVAPIQQLPKVRAGIEPLDDDMREVRQSIDTIEPLVKAIGSAIDGIDGRLSEMSGDLAPVGDLAEKMPGVKRR